MKSNKLYTQTLGHGPDLVLLHGVGTHSQVWQLLAQNLKNHYRVTLVDLPGCGHTPLLPEDHDIDVIIQKVLETTPDSAFWLGWSFGGLLGMKAAVVAPQKIKKLLTIATSPCSTKDTGWPGFSLASWKWIINFFEENHKENANVSFIELTFSFSDFTSTPLMDDAIKQQLESSAVTSLASINNILTLLRDTDFRPLLAEIPSPTQCVFGENDPVVSPTLAQLLKELAPNIQTQIIANAGHVPFLTHRELCLSIIKDFFVQ